MLRDQWRADRMAREPVVTYSRRPAGPPGASRPRGATLTAVEVPYIDPIQAMRAAAASAVSPSGVTLAVLAGVAGIAAAVAMVAASYDASVLQPNRIATAYPATAIVAAQAPAHVQSAPVVVASAMPLQYRQTFTPLPSPAATPDPTVTASIAPAVTDAPLVSLALPVPVEPPHPRLRPAVPVAPAPAPAGAKVVVASVPAPVRPSAVPDWLETSGGNPTDGTDSDPTPVKTDPSPSEPTHSDPLPGPSADASNVASHSDNGIVGDALRGVSSLVLGTLPPRDVGSTVVVVLQARQVPRGALPVPPAPIPAVIAGAPAIADRGQLMFPLPQSVIIAPATVMRVDGGELGPKIPHIIVPPVTPRLREFAAG